MAVGQNILLGNGFYFINDTAVGLTKGGGQFVTERETREIGADGDRGPVKGRITIDREVPKLTVRILEMLEPSDMKKLYPAMSYDELESKLTSTLEIAEEDYVNVRWEGFTKGGEKVIIEVQNAINMNGIDWSLVDKEETVPEIEYTGTYAEESRDEVPFEITYPDRVV